MENRKKKDSIAVVLFIAIAVISGLLCSDFAEAQSYDHSYNYGYVVIDGQVHYYSSYADSFGYSGIIANSRNHTLTSLEWNWGIVNISVGAGFLLTGIVVNSAMKDWHANSVGTCLMYCGAAFTTISVPLMVIGAKKNRQMREKWKFLTIKS